MSFNSIAILIIVGLVAGWLAGIIWKGRGFGLVGNLVIGIVGSLLGGYIFHLLGIITRTVTGSIAAALVGALVLLYVISKIKK